MHCSYRGILILDLARDERLLGALKELVLIGDFELTLIFNPEKKGLTKILRDYQQEALKSLWKNSEKGLATSEVHEYVSRKIMARLAVHL